MGKSMTQLIISLLVCSIFAVGFESVMVTEMKTSWNKVCDTEDPAQSSVSPWLTSDILLQREAKQAGDSSWPLSNTKNPRVWVHFLLARLPMTRLFAEP